VRTWTRKFLASAPPIEELYDLREDPEELTNVVDAHPDAAKELAAVLEDHIRRFAPLTRGTFQGAADNDDGLTFDALPAIDG